MNIVWLMVGLIRLHKKMQATFTTTKVEDSDAYFIFNEKIDHMIRDFMEHSAIESIIVNAK